MPSSDQYQNEALSGTAFTPNNVWGSTSPTGTQEELTTPLGQTLIARKMSIDSMITAGILTDADALTAQVSKHTRKVKGGKGPDGVKVDESSLLRDSSAIQSLITLIDKAIPHIVVSPSVTLHYTTTTVGKTTVTKAIPPEDRSPGTVYTDQIAFEDKVWLFDWAAGGLSELLAFRK